MIEGYNAAENPEEPGRSGLPDEAKELPVPIPGRSAFSPDPARLTDEQVEKLRALLVSQERNLMAAEARLAAYENLRDVAERIAAFPEEFRETLPELEDALDRLDREKP